jgi:flagellar hook protein FlgE
MSLTGAMNAAVSAMQAQSAALSVISNNLANVSTTGYKASSASFSSLVTSSNSSTQSGGVTVSGVQNLLASGTLVDSDIDTNIAISGSGFFAVQAEEGGEIYYTRDGSFTIDTDGYLSNGDYTLLGWPTDADGNVTGGTTETNLEMIDTDTISSYAAATTEVSLEGNLPADAAVGTTYSSEVEVFDSLGTPYTLTVSWEKTATNTWSMTVADPTLNGVDAGDVTSTSTTVTFNEDGTLLSPESATLTISDLTTGASDMSIAFSLGTAGAADGITQQTNSSSQSVDITPTANGASYGTLSGITIDEDGTVTANYSNNVSVAIYKIPLATFANADGLTAMSGSVYAVSTKSSSASFHFATTDGVGSIKANTLEESTTDTNTEFSAMIAAQQAYSAASQVISTAKDMFDSLLSAVR